MTPRFKELQQLILPKYPYKERLKLTKGSNIKILTSRSIQKLGLSMSVFGNDLIEDTDGQRAIINLFVVFGRIATNVMIKGVFAHSLVSDTQFWSSVSLDFSNSDLTEAEFKEEFSKLIVRLSLGWGTGKVSTAISQANRLLSGKLRTTEIVAPLAKRLKDDLRAILAEAASDGTIDLSSATDSPILSDVSGDDYLDNEYQRVLEKEIKLFLDLHKIGYSDEDLNSLNITLFKPNNNPMNPKSTINSEDVFVETESSSNRPGRGTEQEVIVSSLYSKETAQAGDVVPLQKNVGWFLEWSPAQTAGVLKVPIGQAFPERLPVHNVLVISDIAATERLETYMSTINYLPMSSAHLVFLQDFTISRMPIIAKDVTLGSRYVQKLTENFPQFSIRISALRFGDVHTRVLNFINALTTFTGNPRKYPGTVYLYSAFLLDMPSMQRTYYRAENYYKKYEIVPMNVAKRANATNNTMIDIIVSGIVVGHNENY